MRSTLREDDEWLTDKEVAARWKCTRVALAARRARGEGPRFFKLGRMVRYRLSDVEELEARGLRQTDDEPSPDTDDNLHYVETAPAAAAAEG